MSDLVERINAACVGHPHAKISWPHRLLHDARDEITRLRVALDNAEAALADIICACDLMDHSDPKQSLWDCIQQVDRRASRGLSRKAQPTQAQQAIKALDVIADALKLQRVPPGWKLVPEKLLREAFAVMRECGWHLAVAAEPETDGVLEAACTEIHDQFADLLAAAPQPPGSE